MSLGYGTASLSTSSAPTSFPRSRHSDSSARQVRQHGGEVLGQRPDGVDGQRLAVPRRELREAPFHVPPVAAFMPARDTAAALLQPGLVQLAVRARADDNPELRA